MIDLLIDAKELIESRIKELEQCKRLSASDREWLDRAREFLQVCKGAI